MEPRNYQHFNSKEVRDIVSRGENPSGSAKNRNFIPGGLFPVEGVDPILPTNVRNSEDNNDSGYPDVKQTLKDLEDRLTHLKDRHQDTNPSPDTENIPDPSCIEQFGRRAILLDRTRRKIRVGREIKKIIDCGSNLLDWAQKSFKGKGTEIGPETSTEVRPETSTEVIDTLRWLAAYAYYKHSLALKPSDGGAKLSTDEINELQRLATHPYHKYLFGSKSSDEGTELGDTKSRKAALTQLTQIAQELQAWDQHRLGQKDQPPTVQELERREKQELARRKNIKHLLQQLPETRPTLSDLPQREWWQLYIDKPDHENAKQKYPDNPGVLYDKYDPDSPYQRLYGNQRGMENLLGSFVQKGRQKEINYERYTGFYRLVTKGIDFTDEEREFIPQPNGLDSDNPVDGFLIYASHSLVPQESREDRLERLVALKEMSGERYNGLPLFQDWPTGVEQPKGNERVTPEIAKALPQGITIGREFFLKSNSYYPEGYVTVITPLYSKKECPKLVGAILESYYKGRKVPGQTDYDRLREIAKHIRALHMMHPKHDAHGRVHLKWLLNKWLQEEGFSLIIHSGKPHEFRGNKTLDRLVEYILIGTRDFIEVVNKCKVAS